MKALRIRACRRFMVTTLVTMGVLMAGKTRHMVNRSGRYLARLVVPKDLREIVGKTELRAPLGGDYREALRLLPGAVAHRVIRGRASGKILICPH